MPYEFLAVKIHQQNIREGVARQAKRDLLKSLSRTTPRKGASRVQTPLDEQHVEHAPARPTQQRGW